jgi:aspartate aminotransferase
MPGGAFYVFPDVSAFFGRKTAEGQAIDSATDVAMYLLRQVAVASVPGEGFGAPAHVRLSYATSREALEQGIGRIAEALSRLR